MEKPTGGETPSAATAEKTDIPAPASAEAVRSLEKPPQQDFTAKISQAENSPRAMRALIEEAKKAGLRAPKPEDMLPIGQKSKVLEIPPDLKALEAEATPPAPEGQPAETPAEPEATPEAETPPTPEKDDDDGDTPEDVPVTPSEAKKLRLRLPQDDKVGRLAAAFMQRNRDISMEEALEKAKLQLGVKPQTATPDQPAKPKSDLPDTVEDVDKAFETLDTEREKAFTELRFEDVAKIDRKMRQLDRHRVTIERQQEVQKQESSRTYAKQFSESEAKAVELYEFAKNPDSEGGKRMKEIDDALEETQDSRFDDPNKPLLIAQMVAKEMNIAPRRKGATAPVKPTATSPAVPTAKKQVLPTGSSRTVVPNTNQPPAIQQEITSVKTMADLRNIRKKLGLQV